MIMIMIMILNMILNMNMIINMIMIMNMIMIIGILKGQYWFSITNLDLELCIFSRNGIAYIYQTIPLWLMKYIELML